MTAVIHFSLHEEITDLRTLGWPIQMPVYIGGNQIFLIHNKMSSNIEEYPFLPKCVNSVCLFCNLLSLIHIGLLY